MSAGAKTYYRYLLLLPLFAFLHINNDVFGFIPFKQMVIFLLSYYALAGIVYAIAYLFTRRKPVSILIAFFTVLFSIFFGPYHDFIKLITSGNSLSSYKVVIPFSLLLLAAAIYILSKKPDRLNKFAKYLEVVLTMLVMLELGYGAIYLVQVNKNSNLIYSATPINDQYKSPNIPDSLKPDIYFLVVDGYTNNNTLKEIWNFNNDSITNWLQEKGFYIIRNSRSNYDFTPFSISSTFNMNYFELGTTNLRISPSQFLQSVKSLSNNELFSLLEKEDYAIHFFAPFNSPLEKNNLLHEFGDVASYKLFNHTLAKRVQNDILWNFRSLLPRGETNTSAYNNYEKRVQDIHQIINNIRSTSNPDPARKPQFVYGHLMITHDPHLFYADGTARPAAEVTTGSKLFDTYTQQVGYANTVITQLVTDIRKNNKKNTVIIIEGDHSFRWVPGRNVSYNFPNLNTIYFPDGNYSRLYQEMSPVNTFRVLFNQYFNQKLPLVKDTSIRIKQKP